MAGTFRAFAEWATDDNLALAHDGMREARAGPFHHLDVKAIAQGHLQTIEEKLREMSEIINRVIPWAGSELAAYAWYRSQPLPSLGDATAEELVRQGRAELVRSYLARIAQGGFA